MQGDPPRSGGEQGWLPPEPPGPKPPGGAPPPAGPGGPAPPAAPSQPPAYATPAYGQEGYEAPGWQQAPAAETGNGPAVAALVLGIVSLALLLVSFGISSIVSLACAIAAIPLGRKGRRLVDEGQTRKNRGLAQAGFIMGIIGVVLSVLATIFWTLVVLSDEFQEGFEEGFESSSVGLVALRAAAALGRGILG